MVEGAVYPDLVKTLLRNKGRNAVFKSYTRIHHQDLENSRLRYHGKVWKNMSPFNCGTFTELCTPSSC